MLPELSIELLNRQMAGIEVETITVETNDDGFAYAFGPEPAAAGSS
jgi:hypothetical protein